MMKVFAIVVTYNGMKWYDRCFGSLLASDIPVEILAVDNASTDTTVAYLQDHFPQVKVVLNDKNLGFGQANNVGMRYALDHGADYVFLLNQDAWVEPATIGDLAAIHAKHVEYGVVSCMHLNTDENRIWQLNCVCNDRITDPLLFNDMYFGQVKEIYETKYVNAAAWLLPRKTLETVGGFDPIFFHYGEDDNYIQRVLFHGFKIGICPTQRIVHDMRIDRPLYDSREHEVLMTIAYADVNASHQIKREMRQHWLKTITSFLKGRRQVAKKHRADYLWLKKNRNAIEKSVTANRKEGPNWL